MVQVHLGPPTSQACPLPLILRMAFGGQSRLRFPRIVLVGRCGGWQGQVTR